MHGNEIYLVRVLSLYNRCKLDKMWLMKRVALNTASSLELEALYAILLSFSSVFLNSIDLSKQLASRPIIKQDIIGNPFSLTFCTPMTGGISLEKKDLSASFI